MREDKTGHIIELMCRHMHEKDTHDFNFINKTWIMNYT